MQEIGEENYAVLEKLRISRREDHLKVGHLYNCRELKNENKCTFQSSLQCTTSFLTLSAPDMPYHDLMYSVLLNSPKLSLYCIFLVNTLGEFGFSF